MITELKPTYTMVVIMYIPESKRNLSTPDYERTVYVKSHEKSPTVYSLSLTELCLSLVIIPKIKNFFFIKTRIVFGTVDEGCCVKLSRVTYFRQSSCTHMYYRPPTPCILQKPVGEICTQCLVYFVYLNMLTMQL